MRIGIDIDDTTVNLVEAMLKYAEIFDAETLGRKGCNGNFGLIQNRYYLEALYGWTQEEKGQFFNEFYKNTLEECKPLPKAPEIIRKLKEQGNEIFFITARLNNIPNCDTESITKKMLNENNIPFDKLMINSRNKLQICKENAIEIFIEDSYETCQELEENGIKTFLMTTKMNKDINNGTIERVKDWNEIDEKIENFLQRKIDKK